MRKDPLGYYATLRVSQDAELESVQLPVVELAVYSLDRDVN